MRNKTITIRANQTLMDCLERIAKKYNCSQSDIIHICIFAFNDYEDEDNEMSKYIIKHLKEK